MAKKNQGVDETAIPGQGQPLDEHPRPRRARSRRAAPRTGHRRGQAPAPPAADHQCTPTKIKKTGSNGDEKNIKGADGKPSYVGNFSKGLPHDTFGEVDRAAYKTLLHALDKETDFDKITLGLGRKLTNPQSGLATDPEGPDPKDLEILAAPKLESAEEAAEAVELYWMALLRDVSFTDFATNPDVATAAAELSGLADFTGPKIGGQVTPQTIFRGCEMGDLAGPLVSQYLLHEIGYGAQTISQKMRTVLPNHDYLTTFSEWLQIQNGGMPATRDQLDPTPRYIRNMRDFGQWVHVDALYQAYLNACLILLDNGAPFDAGNPYLPPHPDEKTQIGFGTFGGPHILSLVTEVATRALKAVWYQKWFVHRRLRPEAYGGLIQVQIGGGRRRHAGLPHRSADPQLPGAGADPRQVRLLPAADRLPRGEPDPPGLRRRARHGRRRLRDHPQGLVRRGCAATASRPRCRTPTAPPWWTTPARMPAASPSAASSTRWPPTSRSPATWRGSTGAATTSSRSPWASGWRSISCASSAATTTRRVGPSPCGGSTARR